MNRLEVPRSYRRRVTPLYTPVSEIPFNSAHQLRRPDPYRIQQETREPGAHHCVFNISPAGDRRRYKAEVQNTEQLSRTCCKQLSTGRSQIPRYLGMTRIALATLTLRISGRLRHRVSSSSEWVPMRSYHENENDSTCGPTLL